VLSIFFCLHFYFNDFLPKWMISIIIIRDVLVTVLRNIYFKNNIVLKTSQLGKRKTLVQIISIHLMVIVIIIKEYNFFSINFIFVYYLMLICSILTLWSGLVYFYHYFKIENE